MSEPTIRLATEDDAPAMARLLDSEDIAELSVAPAGRHYLLVAEHATGELAALAVVVVAAHRAELRLLVIAPGSRDAGLADRMIAVAEMLSVAAGCEGLDQPAGLRGN